MDTFAYDHGLPCKNPNCRSHGMPHPNCKCYTGGGEDTGRMAKGGEVHFCSKGKPHLPGCEYFAQGGLAGEDPKIALGHAAAHHGLSGLLKTVGHSKLADPDKHRPILEEARNHIQSLMLPIQDTAPRKTKGMLLAHHLSQGDYEKAADHMQGHPLVGGMGKKDLSGAMERLSTPIMMNEAHPEALRGAMDYLHSAVKGHQAVGAHVSHMFGKGPEVEPEEALRETLKGHLGELEKDPAKLMDVAGSLGHYMPEHATQLAALLSTATDYLASIKPKPTQGASLDEIMPPNRAAQAAYDRQLDLAEQPLLLMQHVKDGTLLPQDIQTVQTIYPGLHKSLVDKAGEAVIDAKQKGVAIPYKQRVTLSAILGQPLDSTLTPQAMQAIISSQGAQQAQHQARATDKASDVELKAINKADAMAQTPLGSRQIDKKDS